MPSLNCSVNSCVYNKSECCCKGNIKVEGENAKNTADTCCESFEEKKGDSYKNASEQVCKTIDVDCKATKCEFNQQYKCNAQHIGIAGGNVCKCADTECSSFKCK